MTPTRAEPAGEATRLAPAAPASLIAVAGRVEQRLGGLLDAERERWSAFDPDVVTLLDALGNLVLGGGKRLRPGFCQWGYVCGGGHPADPAIVDAGAAFELLQAFAVVHDDVMDGSATRRGAPTVHLTFGDRHAEEGWRGESRRFGEGVAILLGDLAHVYADRLLAGAPAEARAVWQELRVELNVGQYLDLVGTARRTTDQVVARRIARYKSGKYTVERPLHLGAALAGMLEPLREGLSAYGQPLGEAFQLRDDLLGAFGDSDVTGKPVGDDLREGKPTLLLATAVQRSADGQAQVLERIGSPELSPDDITSLQEVLVDTGARQVIEATIESLTGQAVAAAARLPVDPAIRDELVELAWFVAHRDR